MIFKVKKNPILLLINDFSISDFSAKVYPDLNVISASLKITLSEF